MLSCRISYGRSSSWGKDMVGVLFLVVLMLCVGCGDEPESDPNRVVGLTTICRFHGTRAERILAPVETEEERKTIPPVPTTFAEKLVHPSSFVSDTSLWQEITICASCEVRASPGGEAISGQPFHSPIERPGECSHHGKKMGWVFLRQARDRKPSDPSLPSSNHGTFGRSEEWRRSTLPQWYWCSYCEDCLRDYYIQVLIPMAGLVH